jgi:hypothetical protein
MKIPKLMRDFLCDKCGKQDERYVSVEVTTYTCECGGRVTRLIGMPRVTLDGTDPDFPGAYAKWANVREQNARIKGKRSYREP